MFDDRVVNETVYVGLSYYGPAMGQDAHLSFFLSALVEVPGYVLCLLLMDRWGRRLLLCFCMIVSGVASISTALMSPGQLHIIIIYFSYIYLFIYYIYTNNIHYLHIKLS